jgi:hypothetical protein
MRKYSKITMVNFIVCGLLFGFVFYIDSVDIFEDKNLNFQSALEIYRRKGLLVKLCMIPIMCYFLTCLNDDLDSIIHFNNILLPFVKNQKVKNVIITALIGTICILAALNVDTIYILFCMALFYPVCFIAIPMLINVRLVPDQDLGLMLFRSSLVAVFAFLSVYSSVNSGLIRIDGYSG